MACTPRAYVASVYAGGMTPSGAQPEVDWSRCGALPRRVCTAAELREIDAAAESMGLPTLVLMENAAWHAASVAHELVGGRPSDVLVACGKGSNGGDGLASARHLLGLGHRVRLVIAGRLHEAKGDAAVHARVGHALGVPVDELGAMSEPDEAVAVLDGPPAPGLVLDAVFGTGLSSDPAGPPAQLIELIGLARQRGAGVLSLDAPSGLMTDTGRPGSRCVTADATVTFAAMKPGFLTPGASSRTGRVIVAPIGVPPRLLESAGIAWRDDRGPEHA